MADSIAHPDSLVCPNCGYSLHGIDASENCPECGQKIDRGAMGMSVIPWTHRREIGVIRAFVPTAILATFKTRRMAAEMNCPVSYPAAQRFRHVCILSVWLPTAVALAVVAVVCDLFGALAWERVVGWMVVALSGWLYLLAVTALPSLFFHPRQLPVLRQNRAVALSYYASCAPLVWWWIPVGIAVPGILMEMYFNPNRTYHLGDLFVFVGGGLALYLHFRMAIGPCRLIRAATQCSTARVWAMGLLVPLGWCVLFGTVLTGIPFLALYAAMILSTLR
jgi:hypothetical protein